MAQRFPMMLCLVARCQYCGGRGQDPNHSSFRPQRNSIDRYCQRDEHGLPFRVRHEPSRDYSKSLSRAA